MDPDFSNVSFLISDWDGTIVDSMQSKTEAFIKTVRDRFPIDPETLRSFYNNSAGMPLSFQIKESLNRFAHIQIKDSVSFEKEFYKYLEGSKPRILEGAKAFLEEVKQKGLKIVIWSGAITKILSKEISNYSLSQYIDYYIGNVIGSNILVKGPGLFKIIAERFGIPEGNLAKKTLVIGDGKADIAAGRQIGAKTAAFRLKNSDADFYFEDYSSLLDKLPNIKTL